MTLSVRTIKDDEVEAWVTRMREGFLDHASEGEGAYRRPGMDLDRSWGAFDGTRVVGTLRSFGTALTVPGCATAAASALTNVTVASTHRRRGLLTEMITSDLRRCRDRDEAIGILIASEYPIYGRFGYGAAIEGAVYALHASQARFRDAAPGSVEFTDLATLRGEAPAVYDRYRLSQPGAIERQPAWWDRTLYQVPVPGRTEPWNGYQALYRADDGTVEGFVLYHAKQDWEGMRPTATLSIDELVAATPAAYQRLWQFCCDVDLVTEITAGNRSVDETLPWLLTDARFLRQTERFDFVWVRVVEPAAALASRQYMTDGEVSLAVSDDLGLAAGTFLLKGGPEGATCQQTTRSPDVSLPVDVLGSVYLGGVSLATLARAGRVVEHRPGALAVADAMFRSPVTPWCATWF